MAAPRLQRRAAVLVCAGQIIVWVRSPKPDGAFDHASQAAVTIFACCYLALAWRAAPATFRRHRLWLGPLLRVTSMALPSQRSATSAAAGMMMSRPPSPGLLGAATDFMRLLLGMRLLSTCAITLMFRLPLAVAVATHTAVVLLSRNNAAYCSTQLLSAATTQGRIAAVVAALDASTLVVLPQGPAMAMAVVTEQLSDKQKCAMALNFLQAACVAVPLLLLALFKDADTQEGEEQDVRQPGRRANTSPAPRLTAIGNAAADAAAAAALHLRQQTVLELAALLWVGSTLTWLLIKAAAV